MMRRFRWVGSVLVVGFLTTSARDARVAPVDPATRGLDVFVHAADAAAAGGHLTLDLAALGYVTPTDARPVGGASFEVGWNPERLGEGERAPENARVRGDAEGHARVRIAVPDGPPADLELLVAATVGKHQRTRALTVHRRARASVRLMVSETKVVPGGAVFAWITARSAGTTLPLANERVALALDEGPYRRASTVVVTDAAGVAGARIPIPVEDDPRIGWTLSARLASNHEVADTVDLQLRDETPGAPRAVATFHEPSLQPGDTGHWTVTVRDAMDRPLERHPVHVWIGKRGETAPEGAAWTREARKFVTDATGAIHGEAKAPTLVKGGVSELFLTAKATVEGDALEATAAVDVRAPAASVSLVPEANALVPGLEQRVFLRIEGDDGAGLAGHFTLSGDGLRADVHTNARGEAEFTWRVPDGIGAARAQGPCAGDVAATVVLQSGADRPVEACVPVDRDAEAIVRVEPPVARTGERVRLAVDTRAHGRGGREGPSGYSVVLRDANGQGAQSAWLAARPGASTTLVLERGGPGLWSATAAGPRVGKRALVATGPLLVAPAVLPRVTARVVGGRAVPGGTVEVEATLDDGAGKPLRGSVSAALVDARGGGDLTPLVEFDTRRALCQQVHVAEERCSELLDGGAGRDADAFRRAAIADRPSVTLPMLDPQALAADELQKAFESVLHSLEGAVLEATADPGKLRDVRRKGPGGWQFNPELFTLVTAAMAPPPVTPGGEPIALGDLLAVDPQVTFDAVARRVTRLKLFRVLAAVRKFKHAHANDRGEPVWRDPNAVLRRLTRGSTLSEDALLDPWGGTIAFARTTTRPPPFLDVLPGYALRAPGPDGVLGTADDVTGPFERVLRSKSPYAVAVQEDRLVDAQFDVEVGEATVGAWEDLFNELTGTTLGNGIGLGSIGTIGHGSGSGGMRGTTRGGAIRTGAAPMPHGATFWLAPRRTGSDGKVRFEVPLGSVPTTWRIGIVADADAGPMATTTVDVTASLPLSVRADTGAYLVAGDVVEARVDVRNDTAAARVVRLTTQADGAGSLAGAPPKPLTVPARGTAAAFVRVRADRAGTGRLTVRAESAGVPTDTLTHPFLVRPQGERVTKARATWVTRDQTLSLELGAGERAEGSPRLVLERGLARTLSGTLHALEPNHLATAHGALLAAETARRIERFAAAQGLNDLAREAKAIRAGASARYTTLAVKSDPATAFLDARARAFFPTEGSASARRSSPDRSEEPACPAALPSLYGATLALESAPPRAEAPWVACWDQAVADAIATVQRSDDTVAIARAVLALADDPQRSAVTAALAGKLRARVASTANGEVTLPADARAREARVLVRAALLRATDPSDVDDAPRGRSSHPSRPSRATLAAWLDVERDAGGGFGSPLASRAAVAALLGADLASAGPSAVIVDDGARTIRLELGPSGRVEIPLGSAKPRVRVDGAPVLARLEQPALRAFTHPPVDTDAPLAIDVTWPKSPEAGAVDLLTVTLRKTVPHVATADVRVPLPAGATLARPQAGVTQLGGVLVLQRDLRTTEEDVFQLPIRFGLRGQLWAPEASARATSGESARAIAPARPIAVGATPTSASAGR